MPAYEKNKAVDDMIAKVMKKKELNEKEAIAYMLGVATGRLTALWRYDKSLPEGKQSKGILKPAGKKKRAEKSKIITTRVAVESTDDAPKKTVRKPSKRKPKAKPAKAADLAAAAE